MSLGLKKRISRTIPFGYKVNEEDDKLLEPIQEELEAIEQAKQYSTIGADEICFLDISATHEKRRAMFNVISKTAETCFVPLTVGGGVNDLSDFRNLLNSGADKVSINSSAVLPIMCRTARWSGEKSSTF